MASFTTSEGVTLAFDDISPAGGPERSVLLIHGFSSNRNEGWRRTGWYGAFERRQMRVIALDQRGHGESEKLYDALAYGRENLAADVLALMDHLGLRQVDLFGYSMGSRTALEVALRAPDRVSNLILGGVGGELLAPSRPSQGEAIVQAMRADDPERIEEPMARSFRHFADEQAEDRRALATFVQARNAPFDPEAMRTLPMPVLVVAGQRDSGAGDPEGLARMFPNGHGMTVSACDHFSAIPHALTKAAVFDFLDGLLDDPFPEGF